MVEEIISFAIMLAKMTCERVKRKIDHWEARNGASILVWNKHRTPGCNGGYEMTATNSSNRQVYHLSERLFEVLELSLSGLSNKDIAAHLGVSDQTVKNHMTKLFSSFNIWGHGGRGLLLAKLIQEGILNVFPAVRQENWIGLPKSSQPALLSYP